MTKVLTTGKIRMNGSVLHRVKMLAYTQSRVCVCLFMCVSESVMLCLTAHFREPFTSIVHTQNSKGWTGLSCPSTSNLSNSILLCPVCTHKYTQTHTDIATQTDRTLSITEVTVQFGWMLSLSPSFLSFCHSLHPCTAELRQCSSALVGGNESHIHCMWCWDWLSHWQNTDELRGEEMPGRDS